MVGPVAGQSGKVLDTAEHVGGAFDLLTVLGLAHGLRERLEDADG